MVKKKQFFSIQPKALRSERLRTETRTMSILWRLRWNARYTRTIRGLPTYRALRKTSHGYRCRWLTMQFVRHQRLWISVGRRKFRSTRARYRSELCSKVTIIIINWHRWDLNFAINVHKSSPRGRKDPNSVLDKFYKREFKLKLQLVTYPLTRLVFE